MAILSLKLFLKTALVCFVLLFPSYSKAKRFKAPYVEFNLDGDWICKSFGVDWVCHHFLQKGSKPALILVTAREGKNTDTLEGYIQLFSKNKTPNNFTRPAKIITVNRNQWVDHMDQNTMFVGMFSRYVATVCCKKSSHKIHVFIGFHTYKENWTKYSSQFLKVIKSLHLTERVRDALAQIQRQTQKQQSEMRSYIDQLMFRDNLDNEDITVKQPSIEDSISFLIKIGLIGLAVFILLTFYYRKKRKHNIQKIYKGKIKRK